MKKILLTATIALFTIVTSHAQQIPDQQITQSQVQDQLHSAKGVSFEKGGFFVEGSISVSTGGDTDSYGINPKVGYFLSDKFAVGGDIDFGGTEVKGSSAETDFFGIGAFARYYFLEIADKRLKAYGDVGLGYGHHRSQGNGYDNTSNDIKANVTLGVNYFFTRHFAATFVLADILTYNNANPEDGDATDTFELNINLFNNIFAQPQFGLLYRF
ncbi:outer membrane beta-barrel protein [Formosa sp. S-31]|uniref:outer membrane beta-barrel protein n=1 Tax=Formosa sp. S-31 TaxID=2790949 RepID=UPI003EB7FB7F